MRTILLVKPQPIRINQRGGRKGTEQFILDIKTTKKYLALYPSFTDWKESLVTRNASRFSFAQHRVIFVKKRVIF